MYVIVVLPLSIPMLIAFPSQDTVARTIVSLRLLRSYGTTLPAEVFHFESEKPAQSQLDELATLGAVVRVAEGLDKQESALRTKSFHIKGSALLQSSFVRSINCPCRPRLIVTTAQDQLLYLDSDSMATKDVTPLFDAPGYLELGVMLWSDFWKDSPQNVSVFRSLRDSDTVADLSCSHFAAHLEHPRRTMP